MESINIRDVSFDWYLEWWDRNRDILYKKNVNWKIYCNGIYVTLRFFLKEDKYNILLQIISRDCYKIYKAFSYLNSHSIIDFFKNWNHKSLKKKIWKTNMKSVRNMR